MIKPCIAWATATTTSMEVLGAAYVLHKRAYQNTSAIVHLLTQNHGLVDAVAKGAAPKPGKARFNLQFFQLLETHCKGKGDLLSLYSSEAIGQAAVLEGKALFCGLYINELLKELLPKHDAAPDIFQLYQTLQDALRRANNSVDLEVLLRSFEVQLLNELGYGIHFVEALTGENLQENTAYYYQMEKGFIPLTQSDIRSKSYFTGKALHNISALDFSHIETRKQAKHLLRSVINHHLGSKSLKSRELFQ